MQSYAPSTNNSILINLINQSTRSLDFEIPLSETHAEHELNESKAEIYSVLFTLNVIEKLFLKNSFDSTDDETFYQDNVNRLIKQYNVIYSNLNLSSLDSLLSELDINMDLFKLAIRRIDIGHDGILERKRLKAQQENELKINNSNSNVDSDVDSYNKDNKTNMSKNNSSTNINANNGSKSRAIAEATGSFITLMDAIKLNYDSKEQLHPLLSDVITCTNKIFTEFNGRGKLVKWLIQLNGMGLDESLSEEELKELLWDVDTGYKGFFTLLE